MHLEPLMPADPARSAVRLLNRLSRQPGGRLVLKTHGPALRRACTELGAARRLRSPRDVVAAAEANLQRALQLAHLSLLTPARRAA